VLRVIRPEAEECRESSDLRKEKDRVLPLNASAFFDRRAGVRGDNFIEKIFG